MKKSIAILAVFAFVAVAASAQITIGGWGRGLFMPVINDGVSGVVDGDKIDGSYSETAPSWGGWGGDAIRVGITIAGNSDNVGFQIDMNGDAGGIGAGDQQKIWVKPTDMVTLQLGNAYDDTLRGNAAFGSFNWYRAYGSGVGEDVTFTRVATTDSTTAFNADTTAFGVQKGAYGQGFTVAVKPNDAIYVVAALSGINGQLTENMFKNIQIAGGYTIEGIGQIRAQYISNYLGTLAFDDDNDGSTPAIPTVVEDTATRFEVAFKMTAVENLYVDLGLGMNLNKDMDPFESKNVALYAKYSGVEKATIHGLVTYGMKKDLDALITIGVGFDYALNDGIALASDVRYTMKNEDQGVADAKTTAFAGVTKGFSNGLIGAGIEIVSAAKTGYAVPVRFEYWF